MPRFQLTSRGTGARISISAELVGILVGHVVRFGGETFALARSRAVVTAWARRWTTIGIFATIARARGVTSTGAIHPWAKLAVSSGRSAIDPRFVTVLNSVMAADAQSFPAITVGTMGIDFAFPGAMWTRSTVIDVNLISVFHAIIAA